MSVSKVGVVGLGTMGHQVAIVFAQGGFETIVCERSGERLDDGMRQVSTFLAKRVEKGKLEQAQADEAHARIGATTTLADIAAADLVVEAVFEDIDAKRAVFAELDRICKPEAILATNTSTLSVTEIAAATQRPSRCLGTHFLIPAALSPLVELSRGLDTSADALATVIEVLKRCGKETVVSEDSPAFIINRLYLPLLNEAFWALQEGVATAEEIDRACVKGLGHPLGPLAASDASGLDVVLDCVESLHAQLGDKYRPAPLLVKLVKSGRLGRKTKRGVYSYP